VEITISWRTILKIAAAALLFFLLVRLWRLIELLSLGLLIALALRPLMQLTVRRGWPKWSGLLLCALLLLGLTALVFGILVPTIGSQGRAFVENLPTFKEHIFERLPSSGPVRHIADRLFSAPAFSNPEPILKKLVSWGGVALQTVAEFFVVLILALYFLADSGRLYEWIVAMLPPRQRKNMTAAAQEVTTVVSRYVAGNIITSVLAAGYAFVVLQLLRVPNAALLAVLAGVFDLLPIIGFFLFTIPATLVALLVSPSTAALVAALYGAYHLIETYLIVPKVYGNRLRLSTLAVLISCLAAGMVAGVVGVIIVLPLVACYPIVERIWLRPYLQPDTAKKHEELDDETHGRAK
jgi:predicted PurR-regulated permease PerM